MALAIELNTTGFSFLSVNTSGKTNMDRVVGIEGFEGQRLF